MRMERLLNAVDKITANEIESRPLNPDWDMAVMDRLIDGDVGWIMQHSDNEIDRFDGRGAQEIRTWLATAAAATTAGQTTETVRYYCDVREWLCSMGLSCWTVERRSHPTG